jgi:hypothetical protein
MKVERRGTEGVDEDACDELERRLLPQAHGPPRRAVQQLQRPCNADARRVETVTSQL